MGQYAQYAAMAGQAIQGFSKRSSAFDDAKLLKRRAGQTVAASQRVANEERRAARLLASTARARAAAGGGNTADESVVNTLAAIDAAGEMNALTRLWDGRVEAENDMDSAAIMRSEGGAAASAGILSAVGTGIETFHSKYGDGEPAIAAPRRAVNSQPGGFNPSDYYG